MLHITPESTNHLNSTQLLALADRHYKLADLDHRDLQSSVRSYKVNTEIANNYLKLASEAGQRERIAAGLGLTD